MTKKYFAIVSVALVLCLALGFGVIKKGPIGDPTKASAPTVVNNNDNLVVGARYNPDNVNALWTQSFDGLALPSGWLNLQDQGSGLWSFTGTGTNPACSPHSGAGMAAFLSYSINVNSNASLVSQSFSLTGGAAKLGFWFYRDANSTYATYADLVNFKINTSPSPTGATLLGTINRSTTLAPVVSAEGWYYYEFNIPTSFNTATNYIIFSAVSQYGDNMYMDDVNVSLLLANDVGAVSIDNPGATGTPSAIVPTATVKNFGSAPQTFPVTMTITPGGYTSTKTVTALAGGTTAQVTFDSWNATVGTYTVKVVTNLATDQDRTNDTLARSTSISTASWQTGAAMTTGSTYMGSGASYMRNDTAWVFCTGGNATLTSLNIYNVRTNTWSTGAASSDSWIVHGSAVVKDTLYCLGGFGSGSAPVTTVDKYNIRTNTWSAGVPLPTALGFVDVVSYQDSIIYVAGGYDGTNASANVYLYNVVSGTWRTATAMPGPRFTGAFMRSGDTLVYVAGASSGSVSSDNTFVGVISQSNRSNITWATKTSYPAGTMLRFNGGTWEPGKVICGAGSPTGAWTPASPCPAYVYNLSADTWTALPSVPVPVLGASYGSVHYGNVYKFIIATGYNGSAAVTNVQVYTDILSGINTISTEVPSSFNLSQNYPNPFNPTTKINFALPKSGNVSLKIYDVMGREVKSLVNEFKSAGTYSVDFNASQFTSGIYFYRLQANGFTDTKKMMLVK